MISIYFPQTLGVNHSRFLIRSPERILNLASRVMNLCPQRLRAERLEVSSHEVLGVLKKQLRSVPPMVPRLRLRLA